jgi:hypothetical protein
MRTDTHGHRWGRGSSMDDVTTTTRAARRNDDLRVRWRCLRTANARRTFRTTWHRGRVTSGSRRPARSRGAATSRRSVTSTGWALNSIGPASCFARACSRADDHSTRHLEGVSPSRTAALALRARRLVSTGSRQQLATSLERLVNAAERAPCPRATAIPLPRREVLEVRAGLLGLAACLRAERPAYARGIALLSALLTNGCGPLYDPHGGPALHDARRAAAEALDGHWAREPLRSPRR